MEFRLRSWDIEDEHILFCVANAQHELAFEQARDVAKVVVDSGKFQGGYHARKSPARHEGRAGLNEFGCCS